MTRDEFEQQYAQRSKLTVEQLHAYGLLGVPCSCGEDGCEGWQMVIESAGRVGIGTPVPRIIPGGKIGIGPVVSHCLVDEWKYLEGCRCLLCRELVVRGAGTEREEGT